jgi:hypothetical protein
VKERIRTKESYSSSGRIFIPTSQAGGPYPYQTKAWYCRDFVEKKKDETTGLTPPSDLELVKGWFKPNFHSYELKWTYGFPTTEGSYKNLPCRNFQSIGEPPLGWVYHEGTDAALTSELLAKTNPFRYTVSVPVMILELVEAATLLKLASNNWISLIGSQHLNYMFGWKASIGDIQALTKITSSIESRIKEFNSLVMKGGLRRRVQLTKSSAQGPEVTTPIISNFLGSWDGLVNTKYTTKVWGSVRWVPNRTSPIDLSKLTAFNEAAKVVLDLRTPDASTIWEAIPFSWLLDYFLNVGDSLQALEDTDKVLPLDICIMRERTVTIDVVGIPNNSDVSPWKRTSTFTAGQHYFEVKLRKVVTVDSVGDLLSFGIMTKGQATNLIALLMSLVRFKR